MIAKIILPHDFEVDYCCDLLVGVDYGAYQLAEKNIMMDIAIGDFDSVSQSQFNQIENYSKKVIRLNVDKNETDSEAALMQLSTLKNYTVKMYSSIGKRLDHLLNNFRLLNKYDFILIDEYNEVRKLVEGTYEINNTHKYFSLFTLDQAVINVSNAKYELDNISFGYNDSYLTSNEFIDKALKIDVLAGEVFIVLSSE